MACSKCGEKGHKAPTCPNQAADWAFQGRADGLTEAQAAKIARDFQKSKRKNAPDAKAVSVTGKSKDLPGKIADIHRKQLGYQDD